MRAERRPLASAEPAQATRLNIRDLVRGQLASRRTLLKFAAVGGLGYLTYQAVLFLLYDASILPFLPDKDTSARIIFFQHTDVRLLIATLVAAELSILAGFSGHSLWTFKDWPVVRKPLWLRLAQFNAKALISTLAILTVTVNILTAEADLRHYMALPIGIALSFTWNWLWDSQFIWRRRSQG